MPELPDVTVYVEALERRLVGEVLEGAKLASPFLLRTAEPKLDEAFGKRVLGVRRMGKRIVLALEDELFLVVHLMIAGRFAWTDEREKKPPAQVGLAAFWFSSGTLLLREASKKKRASLHVVRGEASLAPFERGGLEVLEASFAAFKERLLSESHTLKRSLTDPRLFSGIGNAYSDEILHRARLSPVQLVGNLDDEALARLYDATRTVLREWTERLRAETGEGFPEKVTAFREEMAVHGRYRKPCPVCGTAVQRIVHAENETNYCPRCQTGGKLLADRSLSRLLKSDWPRTIEELESARPAPPAPPEQREGQAAAPRTRKRRP